MWIKPLLKKPTLDSADIWNYRPVSFLSLLSKTLERGIYNQLSFCLSQNYLLDPNQSGIRTAHSTGMALLTVTESLCAAKALPYSSVLILLNRSSTSDSQSPNPLHSGWTCHYWLCSNLVRIIADKSYLSGHMEWLLVQTLPYGYANDTQLFLSFPQSSSNTHVAMRTMFGRYLRLDSCASTQAKS